MEKKFKVKVVGFWFDRACRRAAIKRNGSARRNARQCERGGRSRGGLIQWDPLQDF